ncbi:hypothetical protein HYN48_10185 [Flavobacterium magnum]|uniref:EF-hand domain-containing protein n=1 Tax=Flavobacterium magnum TaxID=2162713 RepID=A0A2S0REQ8_9FLAO|nr:hypothetical protein [Flavobacterium magnum]AWA30427.1 hypothetical protein HYN48_10185 [Flavobacterium magnum]
MKTKTLFLMIVALSVNLTRAQDVTTVNAKNSDISDNLDLRAVASIFGESANLEDFEKRLNDPKAQISNLDLNNDGKVDYLRVIESTESGTHLIVIQSILDKDVFQDIATVEVEKDSNNEAQVQVVGDVYMYGPNYIYEPVYVTRPVIYSVFWTDYYRPYYSQYYWNYYPSYYYTWAPYPIYRYRRHIDVCINEHNHYNYVNVRRSQRAVTLYSGRRSNGYEVSHPNRSFSQRNNNVSNRYELDQTRKTLAAERVNSAPRVTRSGNTSLYGTRNNAATGSVRATTPRTNAETRVRVNTPTRGQSANNEMPVRTTRSETATAPSRTSVQEVRQSTPVRTETSVRTVAPARTIQTETHQSAPVRTETKTRTVQPARSSAPARSQGSSSGAERRNARG